MSETRKALFLKIVGKAEVEGFGEERVAFKNAIPLEPGDYLIHFVWDNERGSRIREHTRIYGLIADVEGLDPRMLGKESA